MDGRTETAYPVPTKVFSNLSPETTMLLHPLLKVFATHLKTKGSAVLQPLTTMMATVKLTQFHAVFCTIGWSSTLMAVSTPEAPVMVLLIITLGRFCPEQEYGTASCMVQTTVCLWFVIVCSFMFVHLVCSYPLLSSVNVNHAQVVDSTLVVQ